MRIRPCARAACISPRAFVYDERMSEIRIALQESGLERAFILIGTAHISKWGAWRVCVYIS
jgi:hypothetical protein